ncbi:hypothetical protein B0T25DRAFT_350312 [Lasiosphaeria hispida]|uniref:Autophagy protein n=1 Tax=Lasiosphaeria hispida TaxID=260671 RepID=A0AAJ0M8J1_9PEZI|nr:hypothetical protein B0T25DRAFT_350312 [Lasiosphaeria hispida]
MGWFDGWFGGSNAASDPLRSLDPKLRDFLSKESPVKYATASDEEHQYQQAHPQPETPAPEPVVTPVARETDSDAPAVPPQSLYQDGRYAHLWKHYKPLASVEAETKSDHEKLMDVLEGYKERKAQIGKAALENCADEQMDWNACMKSGDWTARMTMCRKEVQKFERCYNTQSRLLKALGYLSSYDRPPAVDEQIQMRADELYHTMLDQEAAADKAKAEGLELPKFGPLIPKAAAVPTDPSIPAAVAPAEPGPNTEAAWRRKLEELPEQDRAAEEVALRAEYQAKAEMAVKIQTIWQGQAKEREARKAEGKETIIDRIKNVVGK